MATNMFVNLPVKNLEKSISFFKKLGFKFNAHFTDEKATCMVVAENIFVMLLVKEFFQTFICKEIADAKHMTEVIITLSATSKEQVDEMVDRAVQAGATTPHGRQDDGWMYGHGFQDLDGHLWAIMFVDESNLRQMD